MERIPKNKVKKVLISGINGFVGSHLTDYLVKETPHQIYGTYRRHGTESMGRLDDMGLTPKISGLLECDLMYYNRVYQVLNTVKPDIIFHLAAQSFVKVSWESPEHTLTNNVVSELNIFEACRKLRISPIIHIAGSSEEYGYVDPKECPISEQNELRPLSPYAVSKVAQDRLAYQYHKSYGLKTVITRAFNHEGPGRGAEFVTSAFAKQLAGIKVYNHDPLVKVGNLEAERDFTDVRDIVRAYWLAVNHCEYGEAYNIGSGEKHSISDVLAKFVEISDVKNVVIDCDKALMRPSDVPVLLCDPSKFEKQTGWKREISFDKMLEDIFEYWVRKASR